MAAPVVGMGGGVGRGVLSTKDNLVRRYIISHEAHYCVSGCSKVESA
uniref:Uncharacterized protein n=1 Tax=Medicago truncatula TaxID=3880 RepID=Q2HVV4_MEDTR|nr:hypothetical protein MtrDRAFT_AC148340g30v2 [Medicago truncatula]